MFLLVMGFCLLGLPQDLPNWSVSSSVAVCSLEGQCLLHSQHKFRSPQGPVLPVQLQLEPLWGDAIQVQTPLYPGHMLV